MTQAPRLIQTPYGLAMTGYGAEEDTYINGDIGQGNVPAVLMFVATGPMARAAMHGIEDIGQDNFNVQIRRCADVQILYYLKSAYPHICTSGYILSGTSIPSNFIPFLITLADAAESCKRNCLVASSSACKIDLS